MGRSADVEDVIARSMAAAEELREAGREANQATKDLKGAMREHRELVRQTVREEIDEILRGHATRAMETMTVEVKAAADMVEARVLRRIEGIYELWIEGEREQPTLAELMAHRQALRKGIEAAERDRELAHRNGGGEPSGDGGPAEPSEIVDG